MPLLYYGIIFALIFFLIKIVIIHEKPNLMQIRDGKPTDLTKRWLGCLEKKGTFL
jgi:hypothetical protein